MEQLCTPPPSGQDEGLREEGQGQDCGVPDITSTLSKEEICCHKIVILLIFLSYTFTQSMFSKTWSLEVLSQ